MAHLRRNNLSGVACAAKGPGHTLQGCRSTSTALPCVGLLRAAGCGVVPFQRPTRRAPAVATAASRRDALLSLFASTPLAQLSVGTDDTTTIVNSVLSAYGLPTLKSTAGFKFWDRFEDPFTFEYPQSWVVRPNSLRNGLYISDFKTADKITVEVFPEPEDQDVLHAAVAKAIAPSVLQQDDRLELPNDRFIKQETVMVDGQEYLFLRFPSDTITRSGYQVRRKNFAVAAHKNGMVVTLNASCTTDQCTKDKLQLLQHVAESFRIR